MRFTFLIFLIFFLSFSNLYADPVFTSGLRSFDDIFPGIQPSVKQEAFSSDGYIKTAERINPSSLIGISGSNLNRNIIDTVLKSQPVFFVETITVIPCVPSRYSLLNVYNVLIKISTLQGRLYRSHSRNDNVPLFEEVTRVQSARSNVSVADPLPAINIPATETIFVRLKDVNFGNTYYRADMHLDELGMRYSLTNYRSITYFLFPVMKEEKFVSQLYFEPVKEGILIYGLSGADVSDFVSSRVSMQSAMSKRLEVIISWAAEGIKNRL